MPGLRRRLSVQDSDEDDVFETTEAGIAPKDEVESPWWGRMKLGGVIFIVFFIFWLRYQGASWDPDEEQIQQYYDILGVDQDVSEADLKRALKKQTKIWHPDHNDSPEAEEMFIKIRDAFDILTGKVNKIQDQRFSKKHMTRHDYNKYMKEQKEKRKKGDEFKFSDFDEQEEIRRQNA
eukprot:TRINITY_DN2491_c0_g1_i2.p1 TRINITY_DN2491_c0_g1~~TRINITY_DN2491_c0_g1_i2.p1  ORF type:complete len:178 (+),score=45.37 TRINITY_DN2491_c0_g1_i2:51-584(+)